MDAKILISLNMTIGANILGVYSTLEKKYKYREATHLLL
jgi:hypothetical protein